jgi:hypothetical protein
MVPPLDIIARPLHAALGLFHTRDLGRFLGRPIFLLILAALRAKIRISF